jgi:hypothetical protein
MKISRSGGQVGVDFALIARLGHRLAPMTRHDRRLIARRLRPWRAWLLSPSRYLTRQRRPPAFVPIDQVAPHSGG